MVGLYDGRPIHWNSGVFASFLLHHLVTFLVICPHTENVGVGAFEKGDLYTKKRVGQALSSLGLKGAENMPGD